MLVQNSLDEVDPKLLETFSKLGIPISEQKRLAGVKNVAYDYVFDSESIATTFKKELAAQGIIFCSISEAVREYPDLIKKHLGSVVSLPEQMLVNVLSFVMPHMTDQSLPSRAVTDSALFRIVSGSVFICSTAACALTSSAFQILLLQALRVKVGL